MFRFQHNLPFEAVADGGAAAAQAADGGAHTAASPRVTAKAEPATDDAPVGGKGARTV